MDTRSERAAARMEPWLLGAALLSLPILVARTATIEQPYRGLVEALDWVVWATFATEIVVMLALVPYRRDWLRHHLIDLAIVVFTPPVLPSGVQAARLLRLLRLVRLLALAKYAKRVFSLEGLGWAAAAAALTVVGAGGAFVALEPGRSLTYFDGVWWAIGTMTTLGTDIQPTTDAARILAIALVGMGITFVALLTGAVAERFLGPRIEEELEDLEAEEGADAEAVLGELRAIMDRLQALERRVQHLARPARPG